MGVLAKVVVLAQRNIDQFGVVSARFDTYVTEDGVQISAPEHHRVAFVPGQSLTGEIVVDKTGTKMPIPDRVKNICIAEWTTEVVRDYETKVEQDRMRMTGETAPRVR